MPDQREARQSAIAAFLCDHKSPVLHHEYWSGDYEEAREAAGIILDLLHLPQRGPTSAVYDLRALADYHQESGEAITPETLRQLAIKYEAQEGS